MTAHYRHLRNDDGSVVCGGEQMQGYPGDDVRECSKCRRLTASDARPPSDENREALAAALREIGPVIAEKLLDHQWFRETVERTGREAMSQHPEPARPPSDTGTMEWIVALRNPPHKVGGLSLHQCRTCCALVVEDYMPDHARWHLAALAGQGQP